MDIMVSGADGMKKGQTTLFMIVGLILLIILLLVMYYRPAKEVELVLPSEMQPVNLYAQECLESTVEEGLMYISKRGGYYDVPDNAVTAGMAGWKVPMYLTAEGVFIPTKGRITKELEKYIRCIRPYIKRKNRVRTFFEVLTAIAFLHFVQEETDFTILEVGLGGRLDTTNVTYPLLSVITRIGYDHTQLLGKRLSQIAFEKAGIIKPDGSS